MPIDFEAVFESLKDIDKQYTFKSFLSDMLEEHQDMIDRINERDYNNKKEELEAKYGRELTKMELVRLGWEFI